MKRFLATLVLAAVGCQLPLSPVVAQTSVDLSAFQTPIRHQRERNTCVTFAALAAVEARYKRLGYTLDLSEEFAVSMDKLNWLHAQWSDITTADRTENQLVGTGGGSGTGYLLHMKHWLRVPLETVMPYRWGATAHQLPFPWNSPHWQSQRNVNSWNLRPDNLPREALNQATYYGAQDYVQLSTAASQNPAAIEAVLQAGYEVVWDHYVHPTGSQGSIWHAPSFANGGAHSMLIVGYNRTSPNPANHYFLVKNSYGPTSHPGGFTRISYGYLSLQGYGAAYVTSVRTPGPWTAPKFLGRRNLCFDGWRGTLDIYHLPGSFEQPWLTWAGLSMVDSRIGTFYDAAGNAFRVNGTLSGNELSFWFKPTNPNMRWDEQRSTPTLGRMFKLRIVDGDGDELAGIHWDNAGSTPAPAYGDYARRPSTMSGSDGFLVPDFDLGLPVDPDMWLGKWDVQVADRRFELVVRMRDDTLVPASMLATHAGLQCRLREGTGLWISCSALTERTGTRTLQLTLPGALLSGSLTAHMLSWQRGVAAGFATIAGMTQQAGYLVRTGEHQFGMLSSYGTGCGATGQVPDHWVAGTPEVGQMLTFGASATGSNAIGLLILGLSRTSHDGVPLPMSLAALGAPGCWLRAAPLVTSPVLATGAGVMQLASSFHDPALLGVHLYSQFAVLRPGYNPLGLVFSNGRDTQLGGSF